ncbi:MULTISPECIES: hypothetical protein [unclassified Rhizobium]|uniref:hypothetical protein n=1 Tax=unclassified Rhizobium TaxID=2613769 RepID=UPI000713BDBC|nr:MULTISPECIES: hypothetical protein [unclassified Rhizobium]KQS83248.1 hypothetical protein ASG50_12775 [Rhizobium sp. Leaf386]KQS88865.1 hypothetical protein ASG42_13875 [Rhizobium sp. Leaf391]KQT92711.1 hypothetical protein ASG68_15055 [Rhizobium sp. Leaf453]
MHPASSDLTITEALGDPMIRAIMRADGVTTTEMKTLLYSAASALRQMQPGSVSAKNHTTNLLAAPKRRLLSMVHPLASPSDYRRTAA